MAPTGIGRNVEIFDRLRRWAYAAVTDWRMATRTAGGVYDGWCGAVSERARQIAAEVGAESTRGPLKENEVGHITKSVARWVWERYGADVPPLLRAARIAAQREHERSRQAAREGARERSRMTRAEYVAPAQRRRAEAQDMRRSGISVREIAHVLAVSVREVYRLLESVVVALVGPTGGSSALVVQGSPGLSDFEGGGDATLASPSSSGPAPTDSVNGVVSPSELPTAHGGAIVAAIVSEYAVPARSAELVCDMTDAGRGGRGQIDGGESPIAYIRRRISEIVAKLREPERPP